MGFVNSDNEKFNESLKKLFKWSIVSNEIENLSLALLL